MMKTRKVQPKNNKYYIRLVTGGLNAAVAGSPTIPGANVLCNCVGYANGRFNEIINDPELKGIAIKFKYQLTTNAENFIESAQSQGLKINPTPIQGGIMVWRKGPTLSGRDGAGHVEIVEEVFDDGTILTSASGYNSFPFRTFRRENSNKRWGLPTEYHFRGCIINPSVKNPKVIPAPKLTVDGVGGPATVRAMQKFFSTAQDGIISGQKKANAKYFPSLKSVEYGTGGSPCIKNLQKWLGVTQDGILNEKTVKAWQKKLGVTVDGIFGTKSMKAWQKYLNEHDKPVYLEKTLLEKEMDACKAQADCMKNAVYKWESKPTIEKSKKKGTCVTYVACVLQRLGILKPGQYVWQNGRGYGDGKVVGTNDKMNVEYMGNKSLKSLKDKLKAGDIILLDDNKSGEKGSGGHIMILTGKWTDAGNPYVWDNETSKKGKARAYNGNRKVLARIRLKG